MPNLAVRNVPEGVYKLLHDRARRHSRSLNQEMISILALEADLAKRGLELVRDFPVSNGLSEDGRRRVSRSSRRGRQDGGNRQR
jgi:plasmid stability protein